MTAKMWLRRGAAAAVLAAVVACAGGPPDRIEPLRAAAGDPPETRAAPVTELIHGVPVTDPYRWLELGDSPETRVWVADQQAYTRAFLDEIPGRAAVEQRFEELLRVDALSVPLVRGGRYFYARISAESDLPVICMREGFDGEDVVLIDPHGYSDDHTIGAGLADVAGDGSLMAYTIREGGEDEVVIRLFDVAARQDRPDRFPKGRYWGISILPDGSGLFYTLQGLEGPRLFYHKSGTDAGADRLVFGEGYGPDKTMGASLSGDGRYLLITVGHGSAGVKTELHLASVAPSGEVIKVAAIVDNVDARFQGRLGGGRVYICTDWDAPNSRIFVADAEAPARSGWREIIPESGAVVQYFTLAGGRIFVRCLENAVSAVRVYDADGRPMGEIDFPALGDASGVAGEWEQDEAFVTFQSFHIPRTVFAYAIAGGDGAAIAGGDGAAGGALRVWSRTDVNVDSDRFAVDQKWYASLDGTRVPMFLVHAKDMRLDGSHPLLLSGYGGFNVSLLPRFDPFVMTWLERGGIYAQPSLRGGGELGSDWHRAGMLGAKQNVFDDFIAAAEWLIASGYTSRDRLAISGRSNGGLLVGAALTQRPELFRAVICGYPLLDMIRYHEFLAAPFWVSEYGSAADSQQFLYLLKYSPYHQVVPGIDYPAVLLVSGDADTRVAPMHARKMAARLQAAVAEGEGGPVFLLYDTHTGHVGAAAVSRQVEVLTDQMLFLFGTVMAQ